MKAQGKNRCSGQRSSWDTDDSGKSIKLFRYKKTEPHFREARLIMKRYYMISLIAQVTLQQFLCLFFVIGFITYDIF